MKANYEEDKASLKQQLAEMKNSLQAANVKVTEMEEKLKSSEVIRKQLEERLKNAEVKIDKLEQQGDKENIEDNNDKHYQSPVEFSTRLPYHYLRAHNTDVGIAPKKKQGTGN